MDCAAFSVVFKCDDFNVFKCDGLNVMFATVVLVVNCDGLNVGW